MAPWPYQLCPYSDCAQLITDLLAEMIANGDQARREFTLLCGQQPGGAITCPYCQRAVEYSADGNKLATSELDPLRYSRRKMEMRATDYGLQKTPPDASMTPERWVAEEKLMPGALRHYVYSEDRNP